MNDRTPHSALSLLLYVAVALVILVVIVKLLEKL